VGNSVERVLEGNVTSPSLQGFILISFCPRKKNSKKWLLMGCSRNFDPIFDPIIIAKCSQWGFLRLRITVGRVGNGNFVYYKMYLVFALQWTLPDPLLGCNIPGCFLT
jgi:hypothetical protein